MGPFCLGKKVRMSHVVHSEEEIRQIVHHFVHHVRNKVKTENKTQNIESPKRRMSDFLKLLSYYFISRKDPIQL
nr:hypothetical transcript [Hymenolepis microstoma]